MTTAQRDFIKIQKRLSEQRSEFNGLRAVETRSAEQDTRLTALDSELTDSETEFRTASDALLTEQTTTTAPGGEDTEARERRELCVRANVGDVYGSILEKRGATDGATAEAQAAHGCAPNQIPLAMLAAPTEVRAVTPTPGASQTEQAETIQPVFRHGQRARSSGIDRPTVATWGRRSTRCSKPVRHCGRTAHGLSTDVPDTTGAIRRGPASPPSGIRREFHLPQDGQPCSSANMDSAPCEWRSTAGSKKSSTYEAIAGADGLLNGIEPRRTTTSRRRPHSPLYL